MTRSKSLCLTTLLCLLCNTFSVKDVIAEEAWHGHSLRIYNGFVESVASIDGRDTYMPLELSNNDLLGISYSITYNRFWDVDISASESSGSGTQRNLSGSGNTDNSISVSMQMRRLHLTGKLRLNWHEGILVPWVGGGINGGAIETRERERVLVDGGHVSKRMSTRTSSMVGAHGSAGFDYYPARSSALALALEARYDTAWINGSFSGEIDGFSVLFGLKWDFRQRGL